MGHPQSEDLRIRERFHRRDFGHMDLELTIDDPKMYTRPFTVKATEVLIPDSDVLEYVCTKTKRTAPISESNRGRVFSEQAYRRVDIGGCGNANRLRNQRIILSITQT